MSGAAKVNINVKNLVNNVSTPKTGLFFISARTKRGPVGNPEDIIGSWPQFVTTFGGSVSTNNDWLVCKLILDRGGSLRVNRVVHYTDPTDSSTTTADTAVINKSILLTFDADLVTANQIDMDINGDAITPVVFASDSDTTMAALATEIESHADVADAFTVTPASGNIREIVVMSASNTDVTIASEAVTLGASQAGVTQADVTDVHDDSGTQMFAAAMKNAGLDYNYVSMTIADASNGDANYFNLTVSHSVESDLNEEYTNLKITGNPTADTATFLDNLINASQLLSFSYVDLSSTTGQQRPVNGTYYYGGGDDGDTIVDADWIGDSAGNTGFYAFDAYDDAYAITTAHEPSNAVLVAGSAYTENRKDMVYIGHLPNSNTTSTTLISARSTSAIDSKYTYLVAGGQKVTNPITSVEVELPETPSVLGAITKTQTEAFPFYSFAGTKRGIMSGILSVINNFGTPGKAANLDALIERQINMAINADGRNYITGNYSAQLADEPTKFMNVVMLLIYIKKSLGPLLKNYLEEPNDPKTWKAIWYNVKPFLDSLIRDRAVHDYAWMGDQDANSLDDIQINNATDVANGKYVINFLIKPVAALQEINLNIVITPAAVSFETVAGELL